MRGAVVRPREPSRARKQGGWNRSAIAPTDDAARRGLATSRVPGRPLKQVPARTVAAVSAVLAMAAALGVLTGCASTGGPSACAAPAAPPATLSGDDRRDPVVATDGGGGGVAAWESGTGGPIEASIRSERNWTAATAISRAGARDPSVAMSPGGTAVAVWQWQPVGGSRTIEMSTTRGDGTWTAATMLSTPGASTRDPQVAMDGAGRATVVWRRDTSGDDAVVEVAEQRRDGAWEMPHAISNEGTRARRPRLAVAPNGAAAVVWEQRVGGTQGVAAAARTPGGAWSAPTVVSTGVRSTQEPEVAVGPLGAAVVVWIGRDGEGIGVFASRHDEGPGWSAPVAIGRGADRPRELARPGRAETGADVAVLPDGRTVAAWTLVQDGANRLGVTVGDPTGRWTAPASPGAGGPAGGVQVVPAAGGGAVLTWEELDAGLIRARAELVATARQEGCTDLSPDRTETGGVRPAGGSAPVAVFVDLDRGRVKVADLP